MLSVTNRDIWWKLKLANTVGVRIIVSPWYLINKFKCILKCYQHVNAARLLFHRSGDWMEFTTALWKVFRRNKNNKPQLSPWLLHWEMSEFWFCYHSKSSLGQFWDVVCDRRNIWGVRRNIVIFTTCHYYISLWSNPLFDLLLSHLK